MNKKYLKKLFFKALIRALRTSADVLSGFLVIGVGFADIDWINALSVTGVSILSTFVLAFLTGLPEVDKDDLANQINDELSDD